MVGVQLLEYSIYSLNVRRYDQSEPISLSGKMRFVGGSSYRCNFDVTLRNLRRRYDNAVSSQIRRNVSSQRRCRFVETLHPYDVAERRICGETATSLRCNLEESMTKLRRRFDVAVLS